MAWYLSRYAPFVLNRMVARQMAWARATLFAQPTGQADSTAARVPAVTEARGGHG
jgi:hypothetical protein